MNQYSLLKPISAVVLLSMLLAACASSATPVPTKPSEVTKSTEAPKPTEASKPAGTTQALSPVPAYEILEVQDVSTAGVSRLQVRIRITQAATEAQLRLISEEVVVAQQKTTFYSAIALFFYLPGTDPHGVYTGGGAVWAPNGRWEDANLAKMGNYAQHRLQVTVGSVLKNTPTSSDTDIPESVRRQIYYNLVVAQDSGMGTDESYTYIARKHGIPESTVEKIAREGTRRSWPIPPSR